LENYKTNFNLDNFPRFNYNERVKLLLNTLKQYKLNNLLYSCKHLIIDEIQDLVSIRAEFVEQIIEMLPRQSGFTLLGDSCQSIYDWQIKNKNEITSKKFYIWLKEQKKVEFIEFEKNYRHSQNILTYNRTYRKSIQTNDIKEINKNAQEIIYNIPKLEKVFNKKVNKNELLEFSDKKTLCILCRTNGTALKTSIKLKLSNINHNLLRYKEQEYLNIWIYEVFNNYNKETINMDEFILTYRKQLNETEKSIKEKWYAIISCIEWKNRNKSRFYVEDILQAISENADNSILFHKSYFKITVSNIHKAKGREFDAVILANDIVNNWYKEDNINEEINEHKVRYVGITRPKNKIAISNELQGNYILINKKGDNRCFQVYKPKKMLVVNAIECGMPNDIDYNTLSYTNINDILEKGTSIVALKLVKRKTEEYPYIKYHIYEEEGNIKIGEMSKNFVEQYIICMKTAAENSKLYETKDDIQKYTADEFNEIYIDKIITIISNNIDLEKQACKSFGSICIYKGFTIMGFAKYRRTDY